MTRCTHRRNGVRPHSALDIGDPEMTTAAQKIMHFLSVVGRPVSPSEIARNTKIKPNQVRSRLTELRRADMVRREFPDTTRAIPHTVWELRGLPVFRT